MAVFTAPYQCVLIPGCAYSYTRIRYMWIALSEYRIDMRFALRVSEKSMTASLEAMLVLHFQECRKTLSINQ